MLPALPATEPTLRDLMGHLYAARRFILAGAAAGMIAALIAAWLCVPHYRASMIVAPTTRTGMPDISALFPDNQSYAMEYVIRGCGSGDSSDFARFEQMIRAASVGAVILANNGLRQAIARHRIWRGGRGPAVRNADDVAEYLQRHIRIEAIPNTRMRRIVYFHPDRDFAVRLLSTLYESGDALIRRDLREKTEARIEWLNTSLGRSGNAEHRRALTQLLMEQEQIRMILSLNEPFAATLAEAPAASTRTVWPHKSLLMAGFMLCGGFLGLLLFTLRRPRAAVP